MFSKEFLYINALKYSNGQLKLDYKKLKDKQIVEANNSAFLADSDIIPLDIAHKLNSSQSENPNTYISTLLINDIPTIKPIGEAINSKEFEITQFNQEYNLVIPKVNILETSNYFHLTGLDYIYSAFHIMNLHLEENVCKNELLIFLFNNKAYSLIVNKNGSVAFHSVDDFITFEHIKKTHFYNDDIDRQMLFDEIYYFELNNLINQTLLTYNEKNKDEPINKVTILYTIKQLTNEQIEQLKDEFLINVEYHPINIDEEIFELSNNKHFRKSFIKPRKKKSKSSFIWFVLIILTMIASFVGFKIYSDSDLSVTKIVEKKNEFVQEEKEVKVEKKEEVIVKPIEQIKEEVKVVPKVEEKIEIKLPDHVNLNEIIINKINSIFGAMSYDIVLKDIKIEDNLVVLNGTLLKKNTFNKSLKKNLEKLYKSVELTILDKNKKSKIDASIILKDEILSDVSYKNFKGKYETDKYLESTTISEQIKSLLPTNAIIRDMGENKIDMISKHMYSVNILTRTPLEFFDLIDKLNLQNNSINVTYPIVMKKTPNGIEIDFNLNYNQADKLQ